MVSLLDIIKRYSIVIIMLLSFVAILFLSKLVFAENQKNFVKCNFNRTLKIGSRGLDVFCLQVLLYQEGFLQNPLKSAGYYNLETKQAVKKWQAKNKISPTTGIFGPISISFYKNYYLKKISINPQTSTENNFTLSLPEIEKSEIAEKKLLILPEIKDEEIKISSEGYSDIIEYLQFYLTDFNKNLVDDLSKNQDIFNQLQKIFIESQDKNEVFSFSAYVHLSKYLYGHEDDLENLNNKLLFLKKFYEIKVNKLKEIKISSNLKDIHKKFILNDYAEVILIDKFFEHQKGKIGQDDLKGLLKEYENFRNDLVIDIQKQISIPETSKLRRTFIKEVNAAVKLPFTPFGGKILSVIPCTCSAGFAVVIGPPRPAIIFVPIAFLASPLNHLWRQILTPGVWALGLYFPPPVPCLVYAGITCVPAPVQPLGTIFRSGTSLIPGP